MLASPNVAASKKVYERIRKQTDEWISLEFFYLILLTQISRDASSSESIADGS